MAGNAIDTVDHQGNVRRLGTIPLPIPDAFVGSFPTYAEAKPMFSRDELVSFAKERDTRGRTKFDSSWILDQKSHGSCNGFAIAAALSRARVRRGLPKVILSGAYAYSLMNGGGDNGSALVDGMKVSMASGLATQDTVPWDAIYPKRYDRAKADAEAARFRAFECYTITSELELFSALAADFDVVTAVDVDNSYMHADANGVVGGGRGQGNHSTACDGYVVLPDGRLAGDNEGSWGLSWAVQGRAYLTWDRHWAQTVRYHGFYAVRGATDDQQGENPPPINP